jgi:hypothetical protein
MYIYLLATPDDGKEEASDNRHFVSSTHTQFFLYYHRRHQLSNSARLLLFLSHRAYMIKHFKIPIKSFFFHFSINRNLNSGELLSNHFPMFFSLIISKMFSF